MTLLEMGFYCGLSILYPYVPVYCPADSCMGDCRGVYLYNAKSAPLPDGHEWCEWADSSDRDPNNNWYQWKPRIIAPDRQKYLGRRVCYLEDRGRPMNINEIQRSGR